jgi:RHS repeat-associated protein
MWNKSSKKRRLSILEKNKARQLDIESLEQRTGPTETIGAGLSIYTLLHLNPRSESAHADSAVGRTASPFDLATPTERLWLIQLPEDFPSSTVHGYVPPPYSAHTEEVSVAQSSSSDFRRTDFQSVPLFKLDLIDDQNLRSGGGGGGELKNGPLGGGGGDNSHGAAPNTNTGPGAGSGAPSPLGRGQGEGSSTGGGPSAPPTPGKGNGGKAGPLVSSGHLTVYVLDQNNGLFLNGNVNVTDFSTYSVTLDAEVWGTASPTYTWSLTNAPDASGATGTSSYRLQFSWASFTGTRTDTVKLTVVSGSDTVIQNLTFLVEGTNSPGYSATQPTTSSTWSSLLPPDAVSEKQAMAGAGPNYSVGLMDGGLRLNHTLPAYNPNVPATQINYVSTAADAQPIFVAHYQLPPGVTVPTSLKAQLTFNGTAGSTYTIGTSYTVNSVTSFEWPGDTLQIALGANASSLSTGRYSYSMAIGDTNATPVTTTYSGSADVVNYKSNAFGAGWSLTGMERIYSVTGGVILDLGDGYSLWFANGGTSGSFVTPAGDFSTLTQNTSTLAYTRTMPDGTTYKFSSAGYQTSVADRVGNTTGYSYNGSNALTSVADLNNQLTTFAYSSGNVTSIQDPANRLATFSYDGTGHLTSIKDANAALWTYGYDTHNNITSMNDPNNRLDSFFYAVGRITSITRPGGSIDQFTEIQRQGLQGGGGGTFAIINNGHGGSLLVPEAPAQYTDANGNEWDTYGDWLGFGAANETVDTLLDTSVTHLNANVLPWLASDGDGNSTRNFFDGSGNTTVVAEANNAVMTYAYNSFSEVTKQTDPNGNVTTNSYDTHGNLTQTQDAKAEITAMTYTSQGYTSTVTDALNHTTTFAYDSVGRLRTTTNALNQVATNLYDSASNLTGTIDARGDRATFSFDSLGRQTQTQDAVGNLSTTLFDSAGNVTTTIDARGDRTTFAFDSLNRQTKVTDSLNEVATSLYDNNGNVTSTIDARGDRSTFSFDAANRQTTSIDPLGDTTTTLFDPAGNVTGTIDARGDRSTFSFDSLNRQTQSQDALGDLATTAYDLAGNVTATIDARGDHTTTSFDALNRATQVQDAAGDLTTTVFDAAGNVTATIDARGHTSTTSFDALNRATQVQDALGDLTTTVFDAAANVTATIDARGDHTTMSFDLDNRQTQVQDARGDLTTTLFDAAGNVTTSIDDRGDRTTFSFDALNRQTTQKDALGNVTTTAYDKAGNVTATTDGGGFITTYAFDKANRRTSVEDPGTGVVTSVYDAAGNVTNTIDAMGDKTTFAFDTLNRQTLVTDPRGGLTTTLYDAVGNQTTVIDPDGNRTTFAFDALNRQTQETDPLNNGSTMVYDAAGNTTSSTDRNANVINYGFDYLNRNTAQTWIQGGSTTNVLTFAYDAAGNQTVAANYAGTTTMAYDTLNRMTGVQEPFGVSLTYSYDAASNRTTTQDSLGGVLTSVYNADNLLQTREFGGVSQTQARDDLTYNTRNDVTTETRYSDVGGTQLVGSTNYSYDSVARVSNIQHSNSTPSVIANYTYSYDLASRLTSEVDNGTTTNYGYDLDSELTSAGSTNYGYDLAGNRTMTGYTTGTGNQMTNDGVWTYTYDKDGNMTEKSMGASATTWFYKYDNLGHMTSATEYSAASGGTLQAQATFVFDALNNRVEQDEWTSATGTVTTRLAYDGLNVWADLNGSNQLQNRRLYLDSVDSVFARIDNSGNLAWYLADHLGSIRVVMNSLDTTTDVISFDAFGNISSDSNSTFGDRYKWTGREFDALTGLQYNRARVYQATVGRWTTEDPLGFGADDVDLYRYVGNTPDGSSDPYGLVKTRPISRGHVNWTWRLVSGNNDQGESSGQYPKNSKNPYFKTLFWWRISVSNGGLDVKAHVNGSGFLDLSGPLTPPGQGIVRFNDSCEEDRIWYISMDKDDGSLSSLVQYTDGYKVPEQQPYAFTEVTITKNDVLSNNNHTLTTTLSLDSTVKFYGHMWKWGCYVGQYTFVWEAYQA